VKPQKLVRHEIIGLHVHIIEAKNPSIKGIEGRIVDETKNTITIETSKGVKRIIKKDVTLDIRTKNGSVKLSGEDLLGRPEERIKKKKRLMKRW
jgi:ribonuclease P protein subunit POP4